jgi:hypothetical protein
MLSTSLWILIYLKAAICLEAATSCIPWLDWNHLGAPCSAMNLLMAIKKDLVEYDSAISTCASNVEANPSRLLWLMPVWASCSRSSLAACRYFSGRARTLLQLPPCHAHSPWPFPPGQSPRTY